MKNFQKKFNKGFTVVEALVAIAILTVSIAATFTAVQSGLQSSYLAKDRITAFYLAQEAFEYIRNVRDDNAIASFDGTPTNWLYELSSGDPDTDNCFFGSSCVVDGANGDYFDNSIVAVCPQNNCPPLQQDPATGLFGYHKNWLATGFRRIIQFTSITANEVRVTITMNWTTSGRPQTFVVTENLLNHE